MNKTELIDKMASEAGISKADAGRALDSFIKTVTQSMVKGEDVMLVGFGTFTTSKRSARSGRNPQTGATIQIAASTVPKFKAGKALKEAVNK